MVCAPLRFSVIVASQRRPRWLRRCLLSLRQQRYSQFEIIIVADRESLQSLDTSEIKPIEFDESNLAKARNLGIGTAAGDVCAFIDDDAAAEPLWLAHLAAGLQKTSADAAVGFVRGRNGISFQSQAASVDAEAETHNEPSAISEAYVPKLGKGRALKLIGTNMAIRRAVLCDLHGFDQNFRFFLEDADLSLRLAEHGFRSAVVPLATVHHSFAPSPRRTQRRAPLDLTDIGRSTAYFLRQHNGSADDLLYARVFQRERARVLRHMVNGTCEPHHVRHRLETLRRGWLEGGALPSQPAAIPQGQTTFLPVSPLTGEQILFSSKWLSQRPKLRRFAKEAVRTGQAASVFSFSLTPFRHQVQFKEPGYWLQTGGVYGKSNREEPAFKWCRFADRLEDEMRRVANERGIGENDSVKWWDNWRSSAPEIRE
ncbi:MAG: glycosyltransferase family 2 protein [Paracoccaceae bacterium]